MEKVAKKLFAVTTVCYGHCEKPSRFEFRDGSLVVQVCPDRYVSRIVGYGRGVDPAQFKKTLRRLARGLEGVESREIRVASRYAWDLGLQRKNDDLVVRLAYWTQGYGRTENESANRMALFLCKNKDSFFTQRMNSRNRLCRSCRA
jgi:hypothetical protein